MLMTMDPDIQKNLKHLGAYDMLKELKTLYAQQADKELLQNNLIYFNAISRDDIYEIVLSSSNTNDSSVYAKRIEKLQHDGLLNSTDNKSFEKCVSCMSRKMARKLYSHQVERATDLLGLIHTDVCGSFKIMSRQGAYYFITFTDDFSRYGYIYLLKHKNEVFETFKVFQKEVENQLGKTIKSLRSDRGGEYMSQKFLDHLKEHEIIAHRTSPYTPQHNGVSETGPTVGMCSRGNCTGPMKYKGLHCIRIHKDGDGDALFQLKSDSLPHAHAQKTKTSAQTLIYKIFLQRYQVYQGRLLPSFQDDAKYEHVGQDTRSQGGKDDQDKQGRSRKTITKAQDQRS
ncbi:retrotransposon protein, putative, ty1-copia subclass [Tanacetum coccineum]